MNLENIKVLAEILNKNGLTCIEITEGETTIKLEKAAAVAPVATVMSTAPFGMPIPTQSTSTMSTSSTVEEKTVNFNNLFEVKSPLVGVFYSAPAPDVNPFVTIGSIVKKGDVLCIVEAMKLMNEIVAEKDGEIVDICLKNGDIVEFGQIMFKIF